MLSTSTLDLLAYAPPGWGATLLAGLWNSLLIALGAYALGLTIGIAGAYGKLYGSPLTKDLLAIYTTVVRAVPELVLILILYFAVTDALNKLVIALGGAGFEISGVAAGIAVLGVVQGAYATEVLRGAIQAVPNGQVEAARAMGMPGMQIAKRIVLPLMLAFAIPGMSNLWLIVTKDTALLAVVGFAELTQATRQAASTTKAFFTFYAAAGLLYLMVSIISTLMFSRIEKWARRGQRRTGD
ncbi:MAG: ABC transporter permease subunit [Rhodobacteraceae bacterium]|nr:ABC transporter permease subunit [Paracoccaceae bacterium]